MATLKSYDQRCFINRILIFFIHEISIDSLMEQKRQSFCGYPLRYFDLYGIILIDEGDIHV